MRQRFMARKLQKHQLNNFLEDFRQFSLQVPTSSSLTYMFLIDHTCVEWPVWVVGREGKVVTDTS